MIKELNTKELNIQNLKVSDATLKNWNRLNVNKSDIEIKLSKRANKLYSKKNIIPIEYFSDKNNVKTINKLIKIINKKNLSVENIIYNLSINLLSTKGFLTVKNDKITINKNYSNLEKILKEVKNNKPNKFLLSLNLPQNEKDILGIIYQSLMQEGNKNAKGSYYTPKFIIDKIKNKINKDTVYLDCSCGTGSFILTLSEKIKNPKNIYGCDIDNIACFISKINLIIKYPQFDFMPNIYNENFLLTNIFNDKKFDLISTNLPWSSKGGINISTNKKQNVNLFSSLTCIDNKIYDAIKSNELFSYFIVKSETLLSNKGKCIFLLPESILNVKTHADIRKFILDKFFITKIEILGQIFSSVLTNVLLLEIDKTKQSKFIEIIDKKSIKHIDQNFYLKNKNYNFSILDNKDAKLLEQIYSIPHITLKDSIFALGIVTGNNKKFITSESKNKEKIFTGKQIIPYFLSDSNNYIEYNKNNFQQSADENIYRAKEKLVYKFISKKLIFAYDNEQRLFLNSANILIPKIQSHSIKTVMAFLNSTLFQYIYEKKFNELKILKGNLLQLPFPILNNKTKKLIEDNVNEYLIKKDKNYLKKIDEIIYNIFSVKM